MTNNNADKIAKAALNRVAIVAAMSGQPMCIKEIVAATGFLVGTVNKCLTKLQRSGDIKYVGTAAWVGRDDLEKRTAMFSVNAPVAITVALTAKRPHESYLGKPAPLAVRREPTPRYKGEIGRVYQREFKPMCGYEAALRDAAALRMLAR